MKHSRTLSLAAGALALFSPVAFANEGQPAGALTGASIFVSPGHGWMWDGERGWRTQRGVTHGVIEDHSNAEAVLQYLVPYLWNAGATVYTMRERCLNPNMVIVQPGGEGFALEGNWDSDRLSGTWNGSGNRGFLLSRCGLARADRKLPGQRRIAPDFRDGHRHGARGFAVRSGGKPT